MNLIIHQFKKDFRRLRMPLLIWLAVIVSQSFLMAYDFSTVMWTTNEIAFYQLIIMKAWIIQTGVLAMMIALLIQEEPLVGTNAFWLTRPISRKVLLQSKSLFCFALLILPVLTSEIIGFLIHGVSVKHIYLGAIEILLNQTLLVLTITALAVITSNFTRFALAGICLWILKFQADFIFQIIPQMFSSDTEGYKNVQNVGIKNSAECISMILGIVLSAGLIGYQYYTRKTKVTIVLLACILIGSFGLEHFWKIDFLTQSNPKANRVDFDDSKITFSVKRNSGFGTSGTGSNGPKIVGLRGDFYFNGVPDGMVLEPVLERSSFMIEGRELANNVNRTREYSYRDDQINLAALKNLFGFSRVINDSDINHEQRESDSIPILEIEEPLFQQYPKNPGNCSSTYKIKAYKYMIAAELPIQQGSRFHKESDQTVIRKIVNQPNGYRFQLGFQNASLLLNPVRVEINWRSEEKQSFFVLYNKNRNEIALPEYSGAGNYRQSFKVKRGAIFGFTEVEFPRSMDRFTFMKSVGPKDPKVDQAWLDNAHLMEIHRVEIGEFERKIEMEGFRLGDIYPDPIAKSTQRNEIEEKAAGSLDEIVLPPNPTKEDVRKYVQAIARFSKGKGVYRETDPEVAKLMAVGSDNVDVLLSVGELNHDMERVIENLAGPQHKDLILKRLSEEKGLIGVVLKNHWQNEVRDLLILELKDTSRFPLFFLRTDWIKAVASFQDPDTYQDLKDYFIKGSNKQSTYHAIKKLPGIDLTDAVNKAWDHSRTHRGPNEIELNWIASIAMQYGNSNALQDCMKRLEISLGRDSGSTFGSITNRNQSVLITLENELEKLPPKSPLRPSLETAKVEIKRTISNENGIRYLDNQLSKAVLKAIDFVGTNPEIVQWFKTNESNLVWDAEKKKFVVKNPQESVSSPTVEK